MIVYQIIKYRMSKEDYAFIKPQLRERKLRLRMIGEKVGVSRQTIQEMLSGKSYISSAVLDVLKEYGIKFLFTGIKVEEDK